MSSILERCVICGHVRLIIVDDKPFLKKKRVYRITCRCKGEHKKNVIGTEQREVIREWNEVMSKATKEETSRD